MAYIIKRNGRFYVIVDRGVDPLTGRRRNKESHPAGTRRRDAENLKTRIEVAKLDHTYKPRDRITLTDYLTERWLPVHERRVAPTTADQYRRNIRLYVTPHIGHVPVQDLRADHLDALYETLSTRGGQNGRGLAPRTVSTVEVWRRGRSARYTPCCDGRWPTRSARSSWPSTSPPRRTRPLSHAAARACTPGVPKSWVGSSRR